MPKHHTFPILFDNALKINISELKSWGYLEQNCRFQTNLTWSRNGEKTGSISMLVNTVDFDPFVILKYSFNDEPREYKVKLIWKPSNLNQGKVWFFVCPKTGKLCRKLYSIGGYFYHREAFRGLNVMYEKQTYSKYDRMLDSKFGAYFNSDKLYEQLYKKNFKKRYAGKPTKKYLKLMEKINEYKSISHHEIELLMIK